MTVKKLLRFLFTEYILTFIDWDQTGDINGADVVRSTILCIMLFLFPNGIKVIMDVLTLAPIHTDITIFLVFYDVVSVLSAFIILVSVVAILKDMVAKSSKFIVYKYR